MKQKLAKQTPKTAKAKILKNAVEEEVALNQNKSAAVVQQHNGKETKKQKVQQIKVDQESEKDIVSKKPKVVLKQKEVVDDEQHENDAGEEQVVIKNIKSKTLAKLIKTKKQNVPEIKIDEESDKEEQEDEVESDDEEAQAENKDDTNEEEDTKIQDKDSTSNTPNTSDCRVYVKNIKLGTTADQIKKYFQSCGEVKSVKIIDRDTNNFAFVNFKDKAAVAEAIKLHNKKFNNATISVYANDPQRKFKKRNEKLTIKLINKQDFKDLDSTKLEDIFSKCGEIVDLVVLCKKNTLAFITFKTEQAVQKAFELNGTTVQDIELEIAAYDTQKPKTTIYVLNIHPAATEEDLKTIFSQAGEISDIALNKGHAVIAFKNSDGYCKSFMLNEVLLKKLPIFIEPYSTRKKSFIKNSKPLMDLNQHGGSVFSPKSSKKNKKRPAEATNVKSAPTPKKAKTKQTN